MTTLHHDLAATDAPRTPVTMTTPGSLGEALALLAGGQAAAVGGGVGHTLARQARRPPRATTLVPVASLPELTAVTWSDDHVTVGAGLRLSAVEADTRLRAAWPVVTEAVGSVATARIRRMVTLGGNIAAADDSHDPPVALAAAGALLTVRSARSTRTLRITDAADLRAGELIQDIRLPLPAHGQTGSAYEKFLVRGVWEYACVNVAAVVHLDDSGTVERLTVAVGSVTGGPVLVDLAGLRGGTVDSALTEEAARRAAAGTRPYGDVRGSAPYKSRMIAEFTRRAVTRAALRAAEGAGR
ncbi:FAD binding domain-containing protein [Streptomyces sp. NBC_01476]|uniref:FAD binding domain-containing protein n=1 Tax=Streptomyces sp. NBC_01476 TaxID=2903881 RepID=UPI002E30F73F|nr:FAD binding domain-containing protein [Streptomyces sp. NBC_01476]